MLIKLIVISLSMKKCIIIRGAAGVGKTTIAKLLAKTINAYYFSFDEVMEKNKLDVIKGDGIPSRNFVKANKLIIPLMQKKKLVVLDGCFYRKEQIEHLLKIFPSKITVFTLNAPLSECIERNKTRANPMTKKAIKEVCSLVSKVKIGVVIDTVGKTKQQIVSEIVLLLN